MVETEDEEARRELCELVQRLGGEVSARDLQQAARARYPKAEDAKSALTDLAEHDLGMFFVDDHDGGPGRPAVRFRLPTNTQLPFSLEKHESCVSVQGTAAHKNGSVPAP
jgi:hypothetical protein